MPCFHPLHGFRSKSRNDNGNYYFTMDMKKGYIDMPMTVPCGQCIGCRLDRSKQWAVRCLHEASLYEDNCFITLTFDDEHLPKNYSLDKVYFQKFMKRLRKRFPDVNIRYFHCGEYGELTKRPHFHACLFNFNFPDLKLYKQGKDGYKLYNSEILQSLWKYGFGVIGDVTFESAAYVARYIMKKVTGDMAEEHYENFVNPKTGEIFKVNPEYTTMSLKPGIGAGWYEKYKNEVYPDDFVVVRGLKLKPPKYYDKLFDVENPKEFKKIKKIRVDKAAEHVDNNTTARLFVREKVQLSKVQKLVRPDI